MKKPVQHSRLHGNRSDKFTFGEAFSMALIGRTNQHAVRISTFLPDTERAFQAERVLKQFNDRRANHLPIYRNNVKRKNVKA